MGVSKKKQDAQSSSSSKRNGKKPMQHDDQEYVSRYQSFTPLNQSLSNILMHVEPKGILTAPLNKKNMSKYCFSHYEKRHGTNNYQALKDEIERFIKHG